MAFEDQFSSDYDNCDNFMDSLEEIQYTLGHKEESRERNQYIQIKYLSLLKKCTKNIPRRG